MTRTRHAPHRAAGLLAAALLAGLAAPAGAASTPGTSATASPDQPQPRRGDYRIEEIGTVVIHAKCEEGGWVFVTTRPADGSTPAAPQDDPAKAAKTAIAPDRDAAIRAACLAIDYTK